MMKFNKAFTKVKHFEGGYSYDPDDLGGETWNGISRSEHPDWNGWEIIDQYKKEHPDKFSKLLHQAPNLKTLVKELYKKEYWNRFNGDNIPEDIGIEMFDIAVNLGLHRAIKYLQIALNKLNRNEQLYNDIVEDGLIGKQTRNALNQYLTKDGDTQLIVKILNILQGIHYINYMTKSLTQEKYARGWFKRVEI